MFARYSKSIVSRQAAKRQITKVLRGRTERIRNPMSEPVPNQITIESEKAALSPERSEGSVQFAGHEQNAEILRFAQDDTLEQAPIS